MWRCVFQPILNYHFPLNTTICEAVAIRCKHIDHSKVPVLDENDLTEQFVKGSGPGGQSVNKTVNCVVLTHIPSGIIVKCHQSRLQSKNRELARELMVEKLDMLINGEQSVQAQKKVIGEKKYLEHKRRRNKLETLKKQWIDREIKKPVEDGPA